MTNSINVASSSPQKTSESAGSSKTKNAQDSINSTDSDDLAASAKSFHESIKKAYDESKSSSETDNTDKTDNTDNELSGNNLPPEDDFPELAAKDDRALLPGGLYLSGQLAADSKPLAKNDAALSQPLTAVTDVEDSIDVEPALLATPAGVDKKISADGKVSEIATQVSQLLNQGTNTDSKNAQSSRMRGSARTTTGATETPSNSADNALIQQTETLTLKTELMGLTGDKAQVLSSTSGQQQLLPNLQTSLLLQTASAQGDASADPLPLTTSSPLNNLSTTNLQSALPQAGITETFGRPAWAQGMGKQILMMVNQNISTAEIRLNPANLGPIEVFIDMSEEQVSVALSSRHAMVREAMEQALPRLREMLEQSGFSLADTDISKHSFAEQREQNADNKQKGSAAGNIDLPAISDVSGQVMKQTSMPTSMVDYYI